MAELLLPTKGVLVRRRGERAEVGVVQGLADGGSKTHVLVHWLASKSRTVEDASHLTSAAMLGMEVRDIPLSRTRESLGEGVVIEKRVLGLREQLLVDIPATGARVWLPYENLPTIKGTRHRFLMGQPGAEKEAERLRLRCLAHAIENWNENTGALSRLEIDPLPHQINLVHHILRSGNLNWLIADDVGLGKTIEIGMLLAALQQRGTFRRILIVTPAGLVHQWKEELYHKFGFNDFRIYGDDFNVNESREWKLYDRVIGSIDRLKQPDQLENILSAGKWDLVIFDEAHRLSRRRFGNKLEAAQRFRLAAALRQTTDNLLLLSGTPHQGMQDKFQALLELLRPDLTDEIRRLESNPEIIRDMVFRNSKALVTDSVGQLIFKGKTIRAVEVPVSDAQKDFDRTLIEYLKKGYAASGERSGAPGRAIGFVMTIYRKLAASSIAAISTALERRLARIAQDNTSAVDPTDVELSEDSPWLGELEEFADAGSAEFFEGEAQRIRTLLSEATQIREEDLKLTAFLNDIVGRIKINNMEEKILIFTEYRSTQQYLVEALQEIYGQGSTQQIHGGMDYGEREEAISKFEQKSDFLVSTEAGGEGLNLQSRCHIIVNYDLPWNPMRLVQRVGRLYRYGQQNQVVVFNVHAPATLDGDIIGMLYQRIDQVVRDMAALGGDYRQGLEEEILGQFAEVLDVDDILRAALDSGPRHTEEQLQAALQEAQVAVLRQQELFEYAMGYDPEETQNELKVDHHHLRAFVEGMCNLMEISIANRSYGDRVWELKLSDELVQKRGGRRILHITFDRSLAVRRKDLEMIDLESKLLQVLVQEAKVYEFGGRCARIEGVDGSALVTSMLRWQNDQGMRLRQEYDMVVVGEDGQCTMNSEQINGWLLAPARDGEGLADAADAEKFLALAEQAIHHRLADLSSRSLHPENFQLIAAAWC